MSPVTSFSLLAVAGASLGIGGFAVIVTALLAGRARKLNWVDWSVVLWLVYDAFTHFVLVSSKKTRINKIVFVWNCFYNSLKGVLEVSYQVLGKGYLNFYQI